MKNETYRQSVGMVKRASLPVTFEAVVNILANGLSQRGGFDKVDYQLDDYQEALHRVIALGLSRPCFEDVLTEMLKAGKAVRLHMTGAGEDDEWHSLTIDKLAEGIERYDASKDWRGRAWDVCNGDPDSRLDFYDYDAVLQFALYGEVAIG